MTDGGAGQWPTELKPMVSLPFVLAPLDSAATFPSGSPGSPGGPKRLRRGLVVGVIVAVVVLALTATAVIVLPRLLAAVGVPASTATPSAPAPTEPPGQPPTEPPSQPPIQPPGSGLPASAPLSLDEFVVPRGAGANAKLFVARPAGPAAPRLLATPAGGRYFGPSLSPDRRTLIYIEGKAGILRTMAVDGSGDRPLIESPPEGCRGIRHMSWSPIDLNAMVVDCASQSGGLDLLLVINLQGEVVRELQTGKARIGDPTLSPDGSTVAYWASDAGGRDGGSIYTLPIDGSATPRALTSRKTGSDADPAWSPDGTAIAFRRRDASNNLDVYAMKADGSGARVLVKGPSLDEKPVWSPDGSRLLVISNRNSAGRPSKTFDVLLLNADGSGLKPLGLGAADISTPCWLHR